MKKIFGLGIAIMLGLCMIGCEEGEIKDTNDQQTKQEQQVEEKEEQTNEVQEPENKVLTMQDETFKHYMTGKMNDEEFAKYFDTIEGAEIEFDGSIAACDLREGYDTRVHMLLNVGDYNAEEYLGGPYIKEEDIAILDLKGNIDIGDNIKVKATVEGYDLDKGYLVINIKEVESR